MNQLLDSKSTPPYDNQQRTLSQVLQFLKTTQMTPQQAQAQVRQYVKDNSVSDEEFERIGNMATQIMRALNLR